MTPNYILEAPITAKDARRRGLQRQACKLIVYFDALPSGNGDREEITFFSSFLNRLQAKQRKLHAQPIGSRIHLDKYENDLKKNGIAYWVDKTYEEKKKSRPSLLTVRCDTEEKIRAIFSAFNSDAIVFFLAEDFNPGGQLEEKLLSRASLKVSLWEFRSGSYEEEYLKEMEAYGLFAFFEDTKLSLEFLGRKDDILRAFSVALLVEKELAMESAPSR